MHYTHMAAPNFYLAVKYCHKTDAICDFSLSPRPCHNLVFFLDGEGELTAGGKTFTVKKGEILFIPRHSTYSSVWRAEPTCTFHSVHFNFTEATDPLYKKITPVQKLPNEKFEELYKAVETLQAKQYTGEDESLFALYAFWLLCGSLFPFIQATPSQTLPSPVSAAISYIENNYTAHYSVEELASLCFLSPSRFYFAFKKETGVSPIVYKNRLVIRHAAQALLLDKGKSVEEIAAEYGFESAIYFRRLFKAQLGKTPTQYRAEEKLL